jgi:DNA-binding CsgD family transcriptional regulator
MRNSFEAVKRQASQQQGLPDFSKQLHLLTPQQRLVLGLFKNGPEITTNQVAALLQIHPRTASTWCKQWCEQKFLVVANTSKKRRSFSLAPQFVPLLAA